MLPEYKYNKLARLKFILGKILRKLGIEKPGIDLLENRTNILIQLVIAIEDAKKFYKISNSNFFDNLNSWGDLEKDLFQKANSLKEFYESWNSDAAIKNVCVNILNQLIWFENYNVCAEYTTKADYIIDYGCGTGALSIGLALDKKIKNQLVLLDVPNDVSGFREFRIKEHSLKNVKQENVYTFKSESKADLIICLDVLEHLENSSSIFMNQMCPLLKVGGYMILRAPWRGQMTHIDAAADDFYLNGGRKYLSQHFEEVNRFGTLDICCVYKKTK